QAAVQTQVIVLSHPPGSPCIMLVVKLSLFIFFLQPFLWFLFSFPIEADDPFLLKFQRRMDNYMEAVLSVLQYIVSTSAYGHTWCLLRELADDIILDRAEIVCHGHSVWSHGLTLSKTVEDPVRA